MRASILGGFTAINTPSAAPLQQLPAIIPQQPPPAPASAPQQSAPLQTLALPAFTMGHIPGIHFQSLPAPPSAGKKPETGSEDWVQPGKLSEWATVSQMQDYLFYYLNWFGTAEDTYWVDVRPIGFKNGQERINWSSGHDMSTLALFSDFLKDKAWREEKEKSPLHVGFFCTSPNWVGTGNGWKKDAWHCWAALLVSQGQGKGVHCLIWDCNATILYKDEMRIRKRVLKHKQYAFIKTLPKTSRIWIGGGGNVEPGQCVQLTLDFIVGIMQQGPDGFPKTAEAWEAMGYREVLV
jgi:hypothetical protein